MAAWRLGDQDAAETHAAAYAAAGAPAFADVVRALASDLRVEVGEILQFLADRAFKAGRGDHSRDLNHVVACLRDSADAWNNFAFLCRETGRFVESFDAYLQAIEREPESPQLQNDAAVVLQYHLPTAANLQKARAMYERAIALADKALQRSDLPAAERERAVQARSDAKLNLEKLDKPDK
jgi:tetratricopeptide (TPR) repeat protein